MRAVYLVETPQVEIVGPTESSVINWITEAELQLRTDGRNSTMSVNYYLSQEVIFLRTLTDEVTDARNGWVEFEA